MRFQKSEVPESLMQETSINAYRNQARRWHVAGTNMAMVIFLLKLQVAEPGKAVAQDREPTAILVQTDIAGLQAYNGENLIGVKAKLGERESKLPLIMAGASMFSWN